MVIHLTSYEWASDIIMTSRGSLDHRHPHEPQASTWPRAAAGTWMRAWPTGAVWTTEVLQGGPFQKMNHFSSQASVIAQLLRTRVIMQLGRMLGDLVSSSLLHTTP